MSQASEDEPNLTPLLDLVLQLVMFFMINANFVMEQVSRDVELPTASMARPQDAADSKLGPVFLNILQTDKYLKGLAEKYDKEESAELKGKISDEIRRLQVATKGQDPVLIQMLGQDEPMLLGGLLAKLKSEYADAKTKCSCQEPPTVVIVRADKDVRYSSVFKVMSVCKSAGFKNMQLRAIQKK